GDRNLSSLFGRMAGTRLRRKSQEKPGDTDRRQCGFLTTRMGLLSFPVIWVFNTDLGPSISRPQFATKADLPARLSGRPERRLGLVEAIGHAVVSAVRRRVRSGRHPAPKLPVGLHAVDAPDYLAFLDHV